MSQQIKHFYEFGEFRIDVTKRRLLRGGEVVSLTPKAFDVLLALAEQSGRMIEKDELMQKVWPNTAVEENNLTQNIYTLRKIFGESRNDSRYIATVPGLGYRFVAEVRRIPFNDEEVTIQEKTEARIVLAETLVEDNGELWSSPVLPVAVTPPLLPAPTKPHRINKKVAGSLAALAILLVMATTYISSKYWRTTPPPEPFRELSVNQLTRTGTTACTAISPDGKHIVYSVREADRESLWMRQLATGSAQQIVSPEEATYQKLTFSHDGNYLYFVKRKLGDHDNVLYKMAALGGIPTQLYAGIEPFIALSPDDRQLTFTRHSASESLLIVANADGSEERQLAARPLTDYFKVPTWSPDGKLIACSTGSGDGIQSSLVGVSLEDGKQKPLTAAKWSWTRWAEWLADGSGLLLTARDLPQQPIQIWYISYPEGEARRVTNDSKDYYSLSLTADSKTLAATQTQLLSEIWVTSLDNSSAAKKLTFGTGYYSDVCFAADGRIVYSSLESGNADLWRMNADGTQKQQLTTAASVDTHQTVSRDGRYIVFASDRAGAFNIWRMNSDGSHPLRLTSGSGEKYPQCSLDGKWVIYNSVVSEDSLYGLWKVPIEGGQPVLVSSQSHHPAVSPDGKRIAYFDRDQLSRIRHKIMIISFASAQPEQVVNLPPDMPLVPEVRWTADSQALLYAAEHQGVSDIWMQPLDGKPAKQLTNLKMEGRLIFDVSPDGKRLVLTRRLWTFDLVLLSNFRSE